MIAPDKAKHFAVGCAVGIAIAIPCGPAAGLFAAIAIGICKEIYDHYHPAHTVDKFDAVWTAIGGAAGAVAVSTVTLALIVIRESA